MKMENKKISSFEDLRVYKMAREFGRKVDKLIKRLPATEKFRLIPQMSRAKLSITNNLAEGYGRYHFQENIQFCRQSRGSIYELIDDFIECSECGYIDEKRCKEYKEQGYRLIKVLKSYIARTKQMKQEYAGTG